jgi:LacI family transcriptional regulator
MSKRATMVDIALRAGVSQATVSLVLNEVTNARVSVATRARVKAIAAELGYARKGSLARAAGAPLIGMLIDEVTTTPFATQLIEGARDAAAAHGCLVAVFCSGGDAAIEQAALDFLAASGAAGLLYATLVTRTVTPPDRLKDLPAILLNCHDPQRRFPMVLPGDVTGGIGATDALIRAGHRRIAHIAGEDWGEAARDRAQGYRRALTTADILFDADLLVGPAWTVDSGRVMTLRLMDLPEPPTAIFCFNDRAAIGCYEALQLRGLRVPEDVSVIGFDNEDLIANLLPPLSTMILPHDEMARVAVAHLMELRDAAGPPAHPRRIKIDCSFVQRQSIGAPPTRAFD